MRKKLVERDYTVESNIPMQQTFQDCPECGRNWEIKPPIPGLIHKTEVCDDCAEKIRLRTRR